MHQLRKQFLGVAWPRKIAAAGSAIAVIGALAAMPAGATAAGPVSRGDLKVVSKYVGAKPKGAAKGTPIDIGIAANDAGAQASPWITKSYQNAARLVNQYFGGIQGHPLRLSVCHMGASTQQGQACGSRFANDSKIKAVLYSGGSIGAEQMVAANNGKKPYFCTIANQSYASAKNMFCTTSGSLAVGTIASYAKSYLKAKSVSLLSLNIPALTGIIDDQRKSLSKHGVNVSTAFAPVGSTNVTSALVAGKVTSTSASILLIPPPSACIPFLRGLTSLKVKSPVITLDACADPSVVKALGGLPQATYLRYGPTKSTPDKGGQMKVLLDAGKAYGSATGQNYEQGFGTALFMTKLMNSIGAKKLSTPTLAAKARGYRGGLFLGDSQLKFGVSGHPAVGSLRARFFTYKKGKWSDATRGKWVTPIN